MNAEGNEEIETPCFMKTCGLQSYHMRFKCPNQNDAHMSQMDIMIEWTDDHDTWASNHSCGFPHRGVPRHQASSWTQTDAQGCALHARDKQAFFFAINLTTAISFQFNSYASMSELSSSVLVIPVRPSEVGDSLMLPLQMMSQRVHTQNHGSASIRPGKRCGR